MFRLMMTAKSVLNEFGITVDPLLTGQRVLGTGGPLGSKGHI